MARITEVTAMGTTYLESIAPPLPKGVYTRWVYTDKNHNQLGDGTEDGAPKVGSLLLLMYWEQDGQGQNAPVTRKEIEHYFLPLEDMGAAEAAQAVRLFAHKIDPHFVLPLPQVVEDTGVDWTVNHLLEKLREHMAREAASVLPAETGATADQTASEMVTALSGLTGNARLPASAVRDIPIGGAGLNQAGV